MWNFYSSKRVTFGKEALQRIAEEFESFPGQNPLVILSTRTLNTKPVTKLLESFDKQGIRHNVSTNVAQEAPVENVEKVFKDFQNSNSDSVIAIGGGSVIDLAKAVALLATNGGNIENYYGLFTVPKPTAPKILVPTTAGAGSEATNIAVLGNKETKSKKGIVSHYLFADWAIVDPELTYSMPRDVTLSTGLDAFCQCLEGFTSKSASPLVDMYALRGMDIISKNLPNSLKGENDARDSVSLGAYLSGVVIAGGNSGTNIGHAIGNTLGGLYGIPHGLAVTTVLEQGVNYNAQNDEYRSRLRRIKDEIGLDVIAFITKMREEFYVPNLSDLRISKKDVPEIALRVMTDQKRLLINNRREVSQEDIEEILVSSF